MRIYGSIRSEGRLTPGLLYQKFKVHFKLQNPDLPDIFGINSPELQANQPHKSIVDERIITIDPQSFQLSDEKQANSAFVSEALRQIQFALANRSSSSHSSEAISFLESDYFKNQIRSKLPEVHQQYPLAEVPDLPASLVETLGKDRKVGDILTMNLPHLARSTGLSIGEAADVRRRLLGLPPRS